METMVPVPGGRLWAEDTGGDGPAVVLVHADWTDSRLWDRLVPVLQPSYRVIRYDLRGFGRSDRATGPFTRLGDLRALLDHFGLAEVVAVGHSGGGGTVLGLAIHEPERVRALVLVAPGIHDYPWPQADPFFTELGTLIEAADKEGIVDLGLRTWAPVTAAPADAAPAGDAAFVRAMMRGAVESVFAIGDLERADPPGFGLLGQVRAPARMLLGDREYPMVAKVSHDIAAGLGGCPVEVIAGADHVFPFGIVKNLGQTISAVTQ
jgi:3-oxoadipate enol-lactonase